jgi:UDP-GlcNAc:undecaprenyl-phosphate/decaprenyl-phosphate GlcNAc-1-phosphate transferase
MYTLFFLSFVSFALSLVLTPVFGRYFRRINVVDRPDGTRKLHQREVPSAGGIPIGVAFVVSYLVLLVLPSNEATLIRSGLPFIWRLLPAIGLVFLTGLLDDLWGLSPLQKLAGQSAGAVAAYLAGVRITGVENYAINSWWVLPVTVLWLIGCTNAINLIDGIDGLACGVGFFATLTTFLAALLQNNLALMLATAPLAGSLLGFLRYNFSPASIFLGDSGSLLIGFLLGCYGVLWSQKSATWLGMTAPLMLMAIPLLDTAISILRRFLRRQPIFGADRGHLHHRLLERGFSPRRVVTILYGLSGIAACFSLLESVAHVQIASLVIVSFCVLSSIFLWKSFERLGYVEIDLAGRMLLNGTFNRQRFSEQLCLRDLDHELVRAKSGGACWSAIRKASETFGFCSVVLHLPRERFNEQFKPTRETDCWNVRITLSDSAYIELHHEYVCRGQETSIAPLIRVLRDRMCSKVEYLEPYKVLRAGGRFEANDSGRYDSNAAGV